MINTNIKKVRNETISEKTVTKEAPIKPYRGINIKFRIIFKRTINKEISKTFLRYLADEKSSDTAGT